MIEIKREQLLQSFPIRHIRIRYHTSLGHGEKTDDTLYADPAP